MKKFISISLLAVIIDQLVKIVVSNNMLINTPIKIINNFFYLTYVTNTGAAWSILNGSRLLLIFLAIMALVAIYIFFIRNQKLKTIEYITYGLLVGGIIGNLIDRVIYGYVIDYLDFYIFNYDFPIFNIADICIVVSVGLFILQTLKGGKYDNSRN